MRWWYCPEWQIIMDDEYVYADEQYINVWIKIEPVMFVP